MEALMPPVASTSTGTATVTTTTTVTTSTTTTTTTTTTQGTGGCSATYAVVNQYPDGFQGEVTVKAGNSGISSWTVTWTFANGQTITQLWNGNLRSSGPTITVKNMSYNAPLAANATTTFGFNATWNNTTNANPSLTCGP